MAAAVENIKQIRRRDVTFAVYENESPEVPDFWQWDAWENHTYRILETFLDKEHSYIDVGVHLGQTVLYGAQLAKFVYAVEPDPEAIRITNKNLALNNISNIKLFPYALGADAAVVRLGCPKNCPSLGASRTSSFFSEEANSFEVRSFSLSSLIENEGIDDLGLVKIDVEGMEDVILANSPCLEVPVYVAIHTPWLSQKYAGYESILRFLSRYSRLTLIGSWSDGTVPVYVDLEHLEDMYVEEETSKGAFFDILAEP